MGCYKYDIEYYGSSLWLGEPGPERDAMAASLEAFVAERLSEKFPDHNVVSEVYARKTPCVITDDPNLDGDELYRYIEIELMWEWCDTHLDTKDGSLLAK